MVQPGGFWVRAGALMLGSVAFGASLGWFVARSMRDRRRPRKPWRIYLMRHGESTGNVDRNLFTFVPDHAIPLTVGGVRREAARHRVNGVLCTGRRSQAGECSWEDTSGDGRRRRRAVLGEPVPTRPPDVRPRRDPFRRREGQRQGRAAPPRAGLGAYSLPAPLRRSLMRPVLAQGNFQDCEIIAECRRLRRKFGPFFYRQCRPRVARSSL